MVNWKIDQIRREIIKHEASRKVLVAGRRFGKSHLSLIWLLSRKIEEGERRWIITPTYRQGKSTTWKLMRQVFRDYKCQINESELAVKLPNDAEVAIKGAEQENNLRGAGLDMVVMLILEGKARMRIGSHGSIQLWMVDMYQKKRLKKLNQ